jgi:hypothetical protein
MATYFDEAAIHLRLNNRMADNLSARETNIVLSLYIYIFKNSELWKLNTPLKNVKHDNFWSGDFYTTSMVALANARASIVLFPSSKS